MKRIFYCALYLLFVALLCLFCVRFAEADWPRFRRFVIGYVVAAPALLYAGNALGSVNAVANALRLGAIVLVVIALGAVARYALRKRDTESMLLLLAGAVSLVFGVHDWMVNQYSVDIRPLMLVPYAGLAFLLLVGWILTDRFVRALNEFEMLNAGLEQRVAEKSEALNEQLAQTRAARDAAEAADRSKSRFLAAASHDLRQPLHALGLFSARLGDRTRDPEDTALIPANELMRDLSEAALKIAVAGLQRRAVLNSKGSDESGFLDPLIEFAEANETPAERKLALFHGEWKGDIDHVFREFAY